MEKLLDEKEAAALLSVSVSTLQMWRHKYKGPAYLRLGRCIRYDRNALVEFVEQSRIIPQ